ncbi:S8 family serine peptidase [Streptomyces sp. NPDC058424]|uniref:S8 family serine peptidase n=1 Tax=Streptomyces sp. NPDC058424 TaxID=3346491 RepID=UPI00364AD09A
MPTGRARRATLGNAVKRSIASGVTYSIAAGNGNILGMPQDACTTPPARVPEAITVGATDNTGGTALDDRAHQRHGPGYGPGQPRTDIDVADEGLYCASADHACTLSVPGRTIFGVRGPYVSL